jgi:hypothetical protein
MELCKVLQRTKTDACSKKIGIFSESSQIFQISILPRSLSERRVRFFHTVYTRYKYMHTPQSLYAGFDFSHKLQRRQVISFFKRLMERYHSLCLFSSLCTSVHTIIQCIPPSQSISSLLSAQKRASSGVPSRESNSGPPYIGLTRYRLSYAAF